MKQSAPERKFAQWWRMLGFEFQSRLIPESEHKFHKTRKWRFDFAWPAAKVAVEIEGICYGRKQGRHQTAAGMAEDCLKYNSAAYLGWSVIRLTPKMITTAEIERIKNHIEGRMK